MEIKRIEGIFPHPDHYEDEKGNWVTSDGKPYVPEATATTEGTPVGFRHFDRKEINCDEPMLKERSEEVENVEQCNMKTVEEVSEHNRETLEEIRKKQTSGSLEVEKMELENRKLAAEIEKMRLNIELKKLTQI